MSMADATDLDETEERARRETLGGSYLGQAIDELRSSGSPDVLYRGHTPGAEALANPARRAFVVALATRAARRRRVESARSAILYSILAAEAYANQYLQWNLTRTEFEAADKLPPFEKYMLGPRLVSGGDLLKRTVEPAPTLKKLLGLRSRLVHPKLLPGSRQSRSATVDPPDFEVFNPLDAARYLVAVADAVGWLLANSRPKPRVDIVAAVIDQERDFFLDFGKRATVELPPFGSEPAPDLFFEALSQRHERIQSEPPADDAGSGVGAA